MFQGLPERDSRTIDLHGVANLLGFLNVAESSRRLLAGWHHVENTQQETIRDLAGNGDAVVLCGHDD